MESDINILIPMAGLGSRFAHTHPNQLKPLIDVCGVAMIKRVIENLNQSQNANFIFVIPNILKNNKDFFNILNESNIKYKILVTETLTEGPACTALLAKDFINNNTPLIITNCDQYIADFSLNDLLTFSKINNAHGVVGVFHSNSNKNSYIKLGNDLRIQEIREKIVISNIATNGLHFWSKGVYFVESAEKMISKNEKYNNEYYIAPSYNNMITDNKNILPYYYNLHFPIGTPDDLNIFVNEVFKTIKHK